MEHIGNGENSGRLTGRDRRIIFSPLWLVFTLALGVFVIETAVMGLIEVLPKMPPLVVFLLDSTLLTLCLSPLLYLNVFRPLFNLIADYRTTETELHAHKNMLEQKVAERTSELAEAVQRLEREAAERRQAESALRESEERFRQLLAQSEDAIVLIAPVSCDFVDVNPTAERLFGRSREQLLAGGVAGLCAAEWVGQLRSAIGSVRQTGDTCAIEQLVSPGSDGTKRILSFRGKLIELQGAALVYANFRDITRRIRLEEQAREMQGRLIHANRMTSLGVLVASVAHEINNPNNYILINAGLLNQTWQDILPILRERYEREGDYRIGKAAYSSVAQFLPDVVDGIQDGARRISAIVDNLKNMSREEQNGSTGATDINDAVRLSAQILNHHIARTTVNFRLELGEGLPPVRGNARQLEQVIINLIMNALQALTDRERGVRVETSLEDDAIVVRVADEGRGIPPEIATRIMEPFFTTRPESGGTGLGLAISAAIVRDQGGSLGFSSEPGKGTVFTVRLQRAVQVGNDAAAEAGDVR